jgi:hypothetical protein
MSLATTGTPYAAASSSVIGSPSSSDGWANALAPANRAARSSPYWYPTSSTRGSSAASCRRRAMYPSVWELSPTSTSRWSVSTRRNARSRSWGSFSGTIRPTNTT